MKDFGKYKLLFLFILVLFGIIFILNYKVKTSSENISKISETIEDDGGPENEIHPLSIEALKKGEYPGSEIVIEQTLNSGSNYKRYIASYKSEGLKIFGLLTVPVGNPPEGGWPVIIFNHGYISPSVYKTTERYIPYQDAFARSGYVTFKSDYRGHGNSEGSALGGYGSNAYTIDVLNAVSSVKKYQSVNPEKIGMWGHSMGGSITLKTMVATKEIKAGVIWAGVVGSYDDLLNNWRRSRPSPTGMQSQSRRWRQELTEKYGSPQDNPDFWNSISPTSYLTDISGPIQLHHGTSDTSVPLEFSQKLDTLLRNNSKVVEFYKYEGDDHNLSNNLSVALTRSVDFFDKYLKGGE